MKTFEQCFRDVNNGGYLTEKSYLNTVTGVQFSEDLARAHEEFHNQIAAELATIHRTVCDIPIIRQALDEKYGKGRYPD